jgi:hypothetical protein
VAEDRDEYLAEARWSFLQARAKQPDIGALID